MKRASSSGTWNHVSVVILPPVRLISLVRSCPSVCPPPVGHCAPGLPYPRSDFHTLTVIQQHSASCLDVESFLYHVYGGRVVKRMSSVYASPLKWRENVHRYHRHGADEKNRLDESLKGGFIKRLGCRKGLSSRPLRDRSCLQSRPLLDTYQEDGFTHTLWKNMSLGLWGFVCQ